MLHRASRFLNLISTQPNHSRHIHDFVVLEQTSPAEPIQNAVFKHSVKTSQELKVVECVPGEEDSDEEVASIEAEGLISEDLSECQHREGNHEDH